MNLKSLITETLLEALNRYRILRHGIDGRDSADYSSLADVAKFLEKRDGGPEYRFDEGLQDEYSRYTFQGFTWADIMNGNPQENGQYKPELINAPVHYLWVHEKIGPSYGGHNPAYSDVWYVYENETERDHIYQGRHIGDCAGGVYLDWPEEDRERLFHPWVGHSATKYLPPVKTLKQAIQTVLREIPIYEKELKDRYGTR